jgi:predicted MPP superfamily phosphohydrolase
LPPAAHAIVFVLALVATVFSFWVFHAWASTSVPWIARHKRGLAAALFGLWAVDNASNRMVMHWHDPIAGVVHTVTFLALMTMILCCIPLALLHLAARRVMPSEKPAAEGTAPPPQPVVTRRQIVEGVGGASILGATGSMLGWGMARGRHEFELVEVPLRIPGLPRALDGYVIAQVSDLHSGTFVGERELDEGLALVRRARPDLIVVTGDVVDFEPLYAPLAARKLADLPVRDGVTAILGNHDYYAGADAVTAALKGAGIELLRDAGRIVRPDDGGGFALIGVDDVSSSKHGRTGPNLESALAGVRPDAPRILLSHQPFTVDWWAGRVAAQLSGHTHGGQINPGFSPLGLLMKYVAGAYEVGGTTLYVNRGFGTVGAPVRIGAPPEVTRFVLVAA